MRQLAEQVKALMGQNGRQNMFQIAISGFRDVDFELDERMLMRLGRVLAVHDHSVPDYDFSGFMMRIRIISSACISGTFRKWRSVTI